MRLRTLPLAAASIITGYSIALQKGASDVFIFVLALSTTLLLQILSNLANDLGDGIKGTDSDQRIGPKRSIQSGAISIKAMKRGVLINAFLALGTGIYLIAVALQENPKVLYFFLGLGIVAILAALGYTLGKKAYGYQGLGDVFVFIFFGLIGVVGTQYLITTSIQLHDLFPAITVGMLSTAVLNMNNMRDHKNDKASNKNTLVVKLGFNRAKYYHLFLIAIALTSNLSYGVVSQQNFIFTLTFLPFIVLSMNVVKTLKIKVEKDLDSELKKIALSTFIYSITLIICTQVSL